MSLINKMLQDLDARNATAAERSALARQLRALPPAKKSVAWKGPVFAAVGALLGAGAVWFALPRDTGHGSGPAEAAAQLPAAAAPAAVPTTPSALPPITVALPADGETTPKPATEPRPRVEDRRSVASRSPEEAGADRGRFLGRSLGVDTSLKVDTSLRLPVAGVASAEASVPPARIDKQPRGGPTMEAAEAEYRKAMVEIRRGAQTEGVSGLRRALQLEPRLAVARQALLSLLVDQRQWAEAEAVCVDGLALDPAQSGWAMILARLQVEKGDTQTAVETLARHGAAAERNADYQAFHALLLHKLQRPREAAARYQAALALRPGEGRWWYGLGLTLEAVPQLSEARAAFQRAREAGNLPGELAAAVEQKLR